MIAFLIPRYPVSMSRLGFYDSFFNTTFYSDHVVRCSCSCYISHLRSSSCHLPAIARFSFIPPTPFQRQSPYLLYFRLPRAAFPFHKLSITSLRPRYPLQWLLYFRGSRIPRKYGSLWGIAPAAILAVLFGSRSKDASTHQGMEQILIHTITRISKWCQKEIRHSRPETPVTTEKKYLSEITLHNTHCYLEFLVFKCHTQKKKKKIHFRVGIWHSIPQTMDQSMNRELMLPWQRANWCCHPLTRGACDIGVQHRNRNVWILCVLN
jgi:hypothetical protein